MNESKKNFESSQVLEFLKNLDSRISKIESRLGIDLSITEDQSAKEERPLNNKFSEPDVLESKLGEYWFANFGILILAIGVALLLILPFNELPSFLPSMGGYIIMGLIFYFSYLLKESYKYISNYLVGTGFVLFYFSTLRLFHFGSDPFLTSQVLETVLLLISVFICLFVSERRKSPYLTSLSLTLGLATGIVIGNSYLIFSLITVMAGFFAYFHIKNDWQYILLFGIGVSYFTHFVWAINNPFWGNQLEILTDPKINLVFIIIYAVVFATGNLLNTRIKGESNITISNSMFNVIGSFTLFQLICLNNPKETIIFYEIVFFIVFLLISILFWAKDHSKYSTSTFALIAYISLSIALIAANEIPDMFIYLIWQSIIVIITSVWYKSKTLTVTNFLIFLSLFFVYLFTAGTFTLISLSFGIVALISARILNWQKQRLTLKTEFMRNTYLAIAFFSVPYTLFKSLPVEYIGLSWLAVSVVYYILSIVLRTFKYRWMAHLTLIGTILYVLIFGISALDTTYKIMTLFSIGIVTFIISILFTWYKKKSQAINADTENNH